MVELEPPPVKKRHILIENENDLIPLLKPIPQQQPPPLFIDWDADNCENYFTINQGFGYATIPKICKPIMDTLIFARLRNIKQLGACYYVYPEAVHTRSSHCIGTADIAGKVGKVIALQKLDGQKSLTGNERLCVIIAALCHDLGHGPWSHLSEHLFEDEGDEKQCSHEELSVLLFQKILNDYSEVKSKLQIHLDDRHFEIIKQLINPKFDDPSKPWTDLIPPEKAFMFAIVNNPQSGLDVDKLDYLSRDTRCGVSGINHDTIDRFIRSVKICKSFDGKYNWLAFPEGDYEAIRTIFEARKFLHKIVYSHKNAIAVTEMLRKAIQLAAPHLKFTTNDNKVVTFKECFTKPCLDVYVRFTDEFVRNQIVFSTSMHPDMIKAREILGNLEIRKLAKPILGYEGLTKHYPCLQPNEIKFQLKECNNKNLSFDINDLLVVQKDFHGGRGLNVNPMDKVLFFSKSNEKQGFYILRPTCINESIVYLFAPPQCKISDVDIIEAKLNEYVSKFDTNNIRLRRLLKNNENDFP